MLAQYFHSMSDEPEARRALEKVGLGDRAHHLPGQLSGGEQQRVAHRRAAWPTIQRSFWRTSPPGNLDAANEQIVLRLLADLHAQGRTILMVTHDENVGRCADRRVNLEHGRIVETANFSMEENQDFDEVLEQLWMAGESSGHSESHH